VEQFEERPPVARAVGGRACWPPHEMSRIELNHAAGMTSLSSSKIPLRACPLTTASVITRLSVASAAAADCRTMAAGGAQQGGARLGGGGGGPARGGRRAAEQVGAESGAAGARRARAEWGGRAVWGRRKEAKKFAFRLPEER